MGDILLRLLFGSIITIVSLIVFLYVAGKAVLWIHDKDEEDRGGEDGT